MRKKHEEFIFFRAVIAFFITSKQCLSELVIKGIEDIRDPNSEMMKEIYKVADKAGVPKNDCVVCHGGNPEATVKEKAHERYAWLILKKIKGQKHFTLHPGSSLDQ